MKINGILKLQHWILFATFISCFTIPLANASFDNAMKIYSDGRYEEAKNAFAAMAEIGDSASLFNLGVMYFRGEAVEKNLVKAYVLMKIANETRDDEKLLKIEKSVFSILDKAQKEKTKSLYKELSQIYGAENIKKNIFPKLLDDKDCPPEILPIYQPPLVYPRSELMSGRMGVVYVEHIISPEGYARDISIMASTSKAFSKASINGIKKFLYDSPVDNKPVLRRLAIIFELEKHPDLKVRAKPFIRDLNDKKLKAQEGDAIAQFLYARGLNTYRQFKDYIPEQDVQYKTANEWYTKSAASGLANAQYEIGRNMLEGQGCEVDLKNGFKWIKAAAVGGFSPAQRFLATSELSEFDSKVVNIDSKISWLKNAAQDKSYGYPAKLLLAWEMVASPEKRILDPDKALKLLDNKSDTYSDELRVLETKAAAWALKGNFKKAIKFQEKGLKVAMKNDWNIPNVGERLEMYKNKQSYIGPYY